MKKPRLFNHPAQHLFRWLLEVLFTPDELVAILACLSVHVALDVQLAAETLGSAEEHAALSGVVDLAYSAEDHVPIRAAEVGRGAQAGDGVGVA